MCIRDSINAVKFAISLGASEEKILTQYSKEEYEKNGAGRSFGSTPCICGMAQRGNR